MGSSTNRSLQAKYKKAITQRQALGAAEGAKPAYRTNKPLLRLIASNAQHMVKCVRNYVHVSEAPVMVLYNPAIIRTEKPLAMRCAVACDGELVRREDYFRR